MNKVKLANHRKRIKVINRMLLSDQFKREVRVIEKDYHATVELMENTYAEMSRFRIFKRIAIRNEIRSFGLYLSDVLHLYKLIKWYQMGEGVDHHLSIAKSIFILPQLFAGRRISFKILRALK